MRTLLIGEIHKDAESKLQTLELQKISNKKFLSQATFSEIEAVIIRTFTKLGKDSLNRLPKLKYVISCSVGMNNIDLDELKERNIELIHCPGSNANSVAEHTLYFIFSLLRQEKPFPELKNKTIGIIGLGYIGKLVAKKLLGCEAKIIAFDVLEQDSKVLEELQVEMKSFDEVIQKADILTVHVPLNEHTKYLINGDVFKKMKKNTFFINTSREEVVDEEALTIQIKEDKFKGIALDTCSKQFMIENKNNKRIIITNHVAAQGEDSFKQMCLQPIEKFLKTLRS